LEPRLAPSHLANAVASSGSSGTRTSRGTSIGSRGRFVNVLKNVFHQLGQIALQLFIYHPAAHTTDAAPSHNKHGNGGGQFIVGNREQVCVGLICEDNGGLFEYLLERLVVVAQLGGKFVLLVFGGGHHPGSQAGNNSGVSPAHEIDEVARDLAVFIAGDTANAGGRALANVAQ
jgi:hypothetical protein